MLQAPVTLVQKPSSYPLTALHQIPHCLVIRPSLDQASANAHANLTQTA